MSNLYGYKFISQFGDNPHDDWITVMTGITGRQIADGLNRCLADYPEWPPGAAQFRALCLGINPRNIDSDGNDASWQLASPSHMLFDDPRRPENNPEHPNYINVRKKVLTDQNKQKLENSANQELKKLKNLFGKKEPVDGNQDGH